MMPFVLDDEMSLPMEFRPYWEMIEQCTLNLENNKHCEEEPEKDLEKDLEKDRKGEALWALDISSRIVRSCFIFVLLLLFSFLRTRWKSLDGGRGAGRSPAW